MKTLLYTCLIIGLCVVSSYGQVLESDVKINAKTNSFIWHSKAITVHESTTNRSWRFAYIDKQLIMLPSYRDGTTASKKNVVECKSWTIATNEIISVLALKLTEFQSKILEEGPPKYTEKDVKVVK